MSTQTVPNNQSLEWYKLAIENNCVGNGGEGKDYDSEELENMYFAKCRIHDDKLEKELIKQSEEILFEELPPKLPLIPNAKFDLYYNEEIKEFIMIPMVIDYINIL